MTAPQSLLQAAVLRAAARLGSGMADTAAGLAVLAQEAPARLQQEWTLFWEEVEREAERIERGEASHPSTPWGEGGDRPTDPQDQIDALRARVAQITQRLEEPAPGPGREGRA
jgi:hypothetical protein